MSVAIVYVSGTVAVGPMSDLVCVMCSSVMKPYIKAS